MRLLLAGAKPMGEPTAELAAVAAEIRCTEALNGFHMLVRQMQAAYAAGLRDGPEACMTWLGNALRGPGNCPRPGADPDWYSHDAWQEGPPWATPPEANCTISEPPPAARPDR
jgi:hypothetical protein